MASVQVTIAGHGYRMACGEGEEGRLEALAAAFDRSIAEMRDAFGEIGDLRLHVMAALTLADDLAEARGRVATLEAEIGRLRADMRDTAERSEAGEREAADALHRTADRIERIAAGLAGPSAGASH